MKHSKALNAFIEESKAGLAECEFCHVAPKFMVPARYSTGYSINLTEVFCPECFTNVVSDVCENRREQIAQVVKAWNSGEYEPSRKQIEVLKKQVSDLMGAVKPIAQFCQAKFFTDGVVQRATAIDRMERWFESTGRRYVFQSKRRA